MMGRMTDRPGRSAADILLELLEKVPDVATLELLIDPENLVRLLRAHGWTDAQIRRDLTAGGRLPGQLLLDVLAKQPDPKVLLDQLGNPAPRPAPAARPALAARPPGAPLVPMSVRARAVAAILFGALLALPSGWVLFVKLDVLRVPGLIVHFPGAYTLLFSALVGGVLLVGKGVRDLRRAPASS